MDDLLKYFQGTTDPLDVVLKKNENNPLVSKVKYAINAIAQYRGLNQILIKGDKIEFPLMVSDTFDSETYEIAQEFFPKFKMTGKMTVRVARRRWAYSAGFHGKAFPDTLSDASNYSELQVTFVNGIVDKAKRRRELIVEDVLKAFEFLGASFIRIVDNSGFEGEAKISVPAGTPVSAGVNANHSKECLREKKFGKNPINIEKANTFISKLNLMPKVVNLIKSRISGNLLSETLNETVSLGAGASLSVSGVGAEAKFKMNRTLEIHVEFYDKAEL
jgi:hypothetical protein